MGNVREKGVPQIDVSGEMESCERYRRLVENSPFCIHEIELDGTLSSMNDVGVKMLGLTHESEVVGSDYLSAVCDSDSTHVGALLDEARKGNTSHFEFKAPNGRAFQSCFVPLTDNIGAVQRIMGITQDITAKKRADQLLRTQNEVLEAIANGQPYQQTLKRIADHIESQTDGIAVSILLVDDEGQHLYHGGASSNLPDTVWQAIEGAPIGGKIGPFCESTSCGVAVYADEIGNANIRSDLRELATKHCFSACWSEPIKDSNGQVMGALAIYSRESGFPDSNQRELFEVFGNLAAMAISRHRTRFALRRSESRFRKIFEQAAVGVVLVDSNTGEFLQANQRYCDMFGYTHDEIVGNRFQNLTHPEDLPATLDSMIRLRSGEISEFAIEKRYFRKDGTIVWGKLTVSPMWEPRDEPTSHIAIVEDISERKQAVEDLRASEEKFAKLFHNSPDAITLTGLEDGMFVDANESACRLSRCTRDELIGRTTMEMDFWVNTDDRERYVEVIKTNGRVVDFEADLRRVSGEVRHAQISGEIISIGGREFILGTIRDITDQKRAEQRLKDSEARLRSMLDALPDLIWMADTEKAFTWFNQSWLSYSGRSLDDEIGNGWAGGVHPDDAAAGWHTFSGAFDRRESFSMEYRLRGQDGEYRWFLGSGKPIFSAAHEFEGYIGACVDIHDRKTAETALAVNEERLRDIFDNVTDLIVSLHPDGKLRINNQAWFETLGYSRDEMSDRSIFDLIAPGHVEHFRKLFLLIANGTDIGSFETVLRANSGDDVYVEGRCNCTVDDSGQTSTIRGIFRDVTAHKEVEQFMELENQLLHDLARGIPLDQALLQLVDFIEKQTSEVIASVLVLDAASRQLFHGGSRRLDTEYIECMDGLQIGEGVGSFGTAAHRGESVFTEDIMTDPFWEPFREVAGEFGIRACWSTPIKDIHDRVLGTFALYRTFPGMPTERHVQVMNAATQMASLLLNRHRDEQQLRESERRFRTIFEQAAVGVGQLDSKSGVILQVNKRYCEIVDRSANQLLGKTWMELTHPMDLAADLAEMDRLRNGEIRQFKLEKQLERGDGSFCCVNLSVSPMWQPGEEPSTHIAIIEDITARKQAQLRILESEERFRSLCSHAPVGIFMSNVDGDLTYVNEMCAQIVGVASGDVLNSGWIAALHPDDRARVETQWKQALFVRRKFVSEYRFVHSGGSEVWVQGTATVRFGPQNEFIGCIGTMTDITERKRSAEALRRSEEHLRIANVSLERRVLERTTELQQANDDLEAYAHSVAHDLRAPLRAMFGFATALREDYGEHLDDIGREYTEFIDFAARQMDQLISDLLQYSKVGSKRMSIDEIELGEVIDWSLKQLERVIVESQARIDVKRPLGVAVGHFSTLVQIVSNLLSNATKFVTPHVEPTIRIWSQPKGEMIRLWVEDNGIGINPAHFEKIFGVFERLHGVESFPGSGIGLAIVRRAVESSNGRFGVQSEPGNGSRFWVEFPTSIVDLKNRNHSDSSL